MSFIKHYGRCCYAKASSKPNNTRSVSINVDLSIFGTVSGGGEYLVGSPVTLVATPNEGYMFEGWYNGDTLVSTESEYTFIVNNSTNLTARFVVDIYNGHEYVEIGGLKWATMNIGASQPSDYGLYFAWGDTQGYTAEQVGSGEGQKYFGWADYKYGNGTSSPGATGMTKYNATDGKTVLEASDDAAVANWGGSWRMPTTAEFQALGAAVNTAWTQVNNVYGILCTDKTDSSKTLFFPAAGGCSNGSVYDVGSNGHYWSSSLRAIYRQYAYYLDFDSNDAYWDSFNYRYCGCAVRPVVD